MAVQMQASHNQMYKLYRLDTHIQHITVTNHGSTDCGLRDHVICTQKNETELKIIANCIPNFKCSYYGKDKAMRKKKLSYFITVPS